MRKLFSIAVVLSAACSYSAEKALISVQIDNIPSTVNHMDVTFSPPGGADKVYSPSIGPGSTTSITLALADPGTTGTFTLDIQAKDRDQNVIATGSFTGAIPADTAEACQVDGVPSICAHVTLQGTGGIGNYASPCDSSGTCLGGLECKKYAGDSVGICTKQCSSAGDCGSTNPLPVCAAFAPSTSAPLYCQWDCTAGTTPLCPNSLACHPVTGTSKSYCQGS